ncbi:MAG TPA: DUF805 domain-containing protein [Paracoccaceae bacterium]|nr:DUF805 domain-containing protein [Paracoccaceae bacterium]
MIAETRYCLRNLTNFSGRDSRQTFWMYVMALVIAQFVLGMIMVIPMIASVVRNLLDAAKAGAEPDQMNDAIAGLMSPMMNDMVIWSGILSLVIAALFIAAFVRRLHDAGYSGWIAVVPLTTQAFATIYGFVQMERVRALMEAALASQDPNAMAQMQAQIGAYSYVGYIGYLVVIVFGVFDSQAGPNRYGDDPSQI